MRRLGKITKTYLIKIQQKQFFSHSKKWISFEESTKENFADDQCDQKKIAKCL